MNCNNIIYKLRSSTEIDPNIESIQLNQPVPISKLRHQFPNIKALFFEIREDKYFKRDHSDYNCYDYLNELCNAFEIESFCFLQGNLNGLPPSVWTPALKNIRLRIIDNINVLIELPEHFENKLEKIVIKGRVPQLPPALFRSLTLQTILLKGSRDAPSLENLNLNLDKEDSFEFRKSHSNGSFPISNDCNQLHTLVLENLPHFQIIGESWDKLENLQKIKLKNIKIEVFNQFIIKQLPVLKFLHISKIAITSLEYVSKMPQLKSIILEHLNIHQLPVHLSESADLTSLIIKNCPNLKEIPDAFLDHPNLSILIIEKCPNLQLPKKILIKPNFKKFSYDFSRCYLHDWAKVLNSNNFLNLLEGISIEERLLLGQFLLEDFNELTDWKAFKSSFFSLLNSKNDLLKKFMLDNGNALLRNAQSNHQAVKNYEGKSIAFIGEPQLSKSIYKEKLIALKFDYQEIAQETTDFLIITDASKLDINGWHQPHYFFTEQQLIHFLRDANPLLVENTDFTEPLRALLWTNELSNDQLVFSMLEGIEIPRAILPDWVAVAQESSDEWVRGHMEALFRFDLPQNVYVVLSSNAPLLRMRRKPFQKICSTIPNFDVAQMAVCQYKRTRNRRYLYRFFESLQYQNHPYRKEMFDAANQELVRLKNNVINYFLGHYTFEKLELNLFDNTFPNLLFQHTSLTSLTLCFEGESFPTEITQLVNLKSLHINTAKKISIKLKTLPINLLDMPILEELIVTTYRHRSYTELPLAFKAWGAQLKLFQIHPTPHYRDDSVKAIRLEYQTHVEDLQYRFPNLKEVTIDFQYEKIYRTSFNETDYLKKLCDTFSFESFEFRFVEGTTLPQSLWTNQLKIIKLDLQDNNNVHIEIPKDFDNQLETIEITGRLHKMPPELFRSSTLRTIQISGISEGLSGIQDAINLEKLIIKCYPKAVLDFPTDGLIHLKCFEFSPLQSLK